jgi:hypothetical protein
MVPCRIIVPYLLGELRPGHTSVYCMLFSSRTIIEVLPKPEPSVARVGFVVAYDPAVRLLALVGTLRVTTISRFLRKGLFCASRREVMTWKRPASPRFINNSAVVGADTPRQRCATNVLFKRACYKRRLQRYDADTNQYGSTMRLLFIYGYRMMDSVAAGWRWQSTAPRWFRRRIRSCGSASGVSRDAAPDNNFKISKKRLVLCLPVEKY